MQSTLIVEAKVVGQKKPLFQDWRVAVDEPCDHLTLAQLITRVVQEEVRAFRQRQEERRLVHFLTAEQIDRAAARGKVDMGGRELNQPVDETAAVRTALQAFRDGLYLVFVDEQEQRDLEAVLELKTSTRLSFVRLVMLAGG